MKSRFIITALIACLPWLAMAQSNDDLYFVPKKETKAKKENVAVQREKRQSSATTVYAAPGSTVVVKDASGRTRNIDEYNRRYTSRDNTFRTQNDTLYIEEKPYGERGEWVNGFEGTQDDYEYAMRIVRFRSPRYAIPVSSPLYWDVVYGAYPSWDWNVYDDGLYAYVFPTYTNPMCGIGDGIGVWQALAGAGVGDGALLIIIVIIAGILRIGMAAGTTHIGVRDGVVRITIITDITDGLATTV